jgi:hypothetical protein
MDATVLSAARDPRCRDRSARARAADTRRDSRCRSREPPTRPHEGGASDAADRPHCEEKSSMLLAPWRADPRMISEADRVCNAPPGRWETEARPGPAVFEANEASLRGALQPGRAGVKAMPRIGGWEAPLARDVRKKARRAGPVCVSSDGTQHTGGTETFPLWRGNHLQAAGLQAVFDGALTFAVQVLHDRNARAGQLWRGEALRAGPTGRGESRLENGTSGNRISVASPLEGLGNGTPGIL